MFLLKVTPVFLIALAVAADKKIELQDIEEDNLKSEKEKDFDKPQLRNQVDNSGLPPLDLLKSGLLRYFQPNPNQQTSYVQQYAVTEPEEKEPMVSKVNQYEAPIGQQAMFGYLSSLPMQIYLVPQYYNEASEQANAQSGVQYEPSVASRVSAYHNPEPVESANYIEIPAYITPSGKAYVQQYTPPVGYVQYATQPTIAPTQVAVTPVLTYQVPVAHYPTTLAAPPVLPKGYYQNEHHTEPNHVDVQENEVENPRKYFSQTEEPYSKPSVKEYPRYYSSRTPIREEHRHGSIPELPSPNPVLLKGTPGHLSHIPKALPIYRPASKPVYAHRGSFIPSTFTPIPSPTYGVPTKRKPSSLLESYIPSHVQIEYLKRGYSKDPISAYEALSSARQFPHYPFSQRQYERGFLPNQMYQTAAGGITYGHFKRTPKSAKVASPK